MDDKIDASRIMAAAYCTFAYPPTAAEAVEQLTAALAAAEKRKAAEEIRQQTLARIKNEAALAHATSLLLRDINTLAQGRITAPSSPLATFRKELQPLAATYGMKIVLVGDKTQATLVQA
jgi:hypothetical protein